MSKVKEFHTPIRRKRLSTKDWEVQDRVGQYEICATEYVIDGGSAWLVKAGEQTYWAANGSIRLAAWDGKRLETFADIVDVKLQRCICEALKRFEEGGISPEPKWRSLPDFCEIASPS